MIEKLKDAKIPEKLLSKWDFSGEHILDKVQSHREKAF